MEIKKEKSGGEVPSEKPKIDYRGYSALRYKDLKDTDMIPQEEMGLWVDEMMNELERNDFWKTGVLEENIKNHPSLSKILRSGLVRASEEAGLPQNMELTLEFEELHKKLMWAADRRERMPDDPSLLRQEAECLSEMRALLSRFNHGKTIIDKKNGREMDLFDSETIVKLGEEERERQILREQVLTAADVNDVLKQNTKNYLYYIQWLKDLFNTRYAGDKGALVAERKSENVIKKMTIENILNRNVDVGYMIDSSEKMGLTKDDMYKNFASKIEMAVDLLAEEGVPGNLLTQEAFKKWLESKKIK